MEGSYYKTKESVDEYIHLAKDVNGKQLIDHLLKVLPEKSSLLELGTGPGTDWNILRDSYNVIGSDNSQEFLDRLNASYPKGTFLELDAVTLNTDHQFDGIYSNKVLHHLADDELARSVARQSEILNPEGIICHSFWKGEGAEVFKGLFVNYHEKEALAAVFSTSFEIISIEPYQEFDDGDSLVLVARKK